MIPDVLLPDHGLLENYLVKITRTDASMRPLQKFPDSDYGIIYGFDFTPCCVPLNCMAWINPKTPGVFLRCFFWPADDEAARRRITDLITEVNYKIPAGAFVISPAGEVLYKNCFYFGGGELNEALLRGLFEPSYEMVKMYWTALLEAATGKSDGIHRH